MVAAAVPLAASALAPELAGAVAPMLAGTALASAPSWLLPAVAGAGLSGIGGLLTKQNPWKSALLGGIGGGISSAINGGQGLSGLFDSGKAAAETGGINLAGGANAAVDAATSPTLAAGSMAGGAPAASSGVLGSAGKFLPYAGLAGGAMLLDHSGQPTQVGPPMQQHPTDRGVAPLNRTAQTVDPRSYLTAGGNRNFYTDINPQLQYLAKGGSVGLGNGAIANSSNKNPTPYPVQGKKRGTLRYFADGGSSNASSSNIPMRGKGDGQSDSIPAMLSDGEFVISAPAVSAFGNGSNDAGAKKLAKIQKNIISRHYSGGKPKKALGLAGYVH